jgi:hypothetical protein
MSKCADFFEEETAEGINLEDLSDETKVSNERTDGKSSSVSHERLLSAV